ncbi:hypothetical protein PVK06_026512 [Gossypium arboreum]|uniref:Uncharacterized protein n=1 Tax=Gossypium arboreum TaxID=29729 RepID=A0ABR0NXY3_GOSAR|nr:hypothetical protein PVK06_026512 [Gossypium arboreum]
MVAATIFTSSSRRSYTFPLVTRWSFGPSYLGLPKQLKDIQQLLDQRSEADMAYANPTIVECIPLKELVNWSMWDAKVPLVVNTMMEMYESV